MPVCYWRDMMIKWLLKYCKLSVYVPTAMQLLLPVGIYLGIQSGASWGWWAFCVFNYLIVYAMVGNNIAMHRYFSHKHFNTNRYVEAVFVWIGSMVTLGDPFSYAMTHAVHHNPKYTDGPLDPHGPARGLKSILILFQKTVDPSETPVFNKHLKHLSEKYGWLHRFYVPFVLVNALILFLISYKLFLFGWLIPASMTCWSVSMSVIRQHYPLSEGVNNCKTHRWEPIYEGLHKNHHDYPAAPNSALKKGEIDYTYEFSKIFSPSYNSKGQPRMEE